MAGYTYGDLCPNCNKPLSRELLYQQRKFCCRKCWQEFHAKNRALRELAEKQKIHHTLSPVRTPPEQCERCRYGQCIGGNWCCNYFEATDRTRHSLHPEGLPDVCQEFEKRKRGRKPKPIKIK